MTGSRPAVGNRWSVLVGRGAVVGAILVGALGGMAAPASAHGVAGTGGSVASFVWSGFTHMITGWDHLLFIAGIVLLARQVGRAAKLISLFAVGHSTTLIIATLAQWRISPTAVDVVIALSVVFVGAAGFVDLAPYWRWFAGYVFGFGLIHGLGLSTRLQDLGLPHEGLLARVIAFNVGVELGQLAAVIAIFALGRMLAPRITWRGARMAAHATLIVAGAVAAATITTVAVRDSDGTGFAATSRSSTPMRIY
jgi:hydrogenase/urease accessory protein HupE